MLVRGSLLACGASAGVVGPSVGCSGTHVPQPSLLPGRSQTEMLGCRLHEGPRVLARTARKFVMCRPPGPQVLALEVGEEGPEMGGSRLATEAGGPTVCSVPGKERCWVPLLGGPAPGE